jgi:hypothetical protein
VNSVERDPETDQGRCHLVRAQFLVRVIAGDDGEIAVALEVSQGTPGGVHHQGIAGLQP